MSSEWFNLRVFGGWHIQIGETRWWYASISYNGYHRAQGYPEGYFQLYYCPVVDQVRRLLRGDSE